MPLAHFSWLWVYCGLVSPEEPMVIGRTGEMDRLHNPLLHVHVHPTPQDSADPTPLGDGWERGMY